MAADHPLLTEGHSVALAFAAFGLALLVATTVLWPVDTVSYDVSVGDRVDSAPAGETFVYEDLPSDMQAVFRWEIDDEPVLGAGSATIRTVEWLRDHEYVAHEGEYYPFETSIVAFDPLEGPFWFLRSYALAMAATVLSITGFAYLDDDPRLLTLPRTLVFPVATVAALGVAYAHDWLLGGPGQVLPVRTTAGTVVPVVTLFTGAGVLALRRSHRAGAAVALALAVISTFATVDEYGWWMSLLVVGLPLAAAGLLARRRSRRAGAAAGFALAVTTTVAIVGLYGPWTDLLVIGLFVAGYLVVGLPFAVLGARTARDRSSSGSGGPPATTAERTP